MINKEVISRWVVLVVDDDADSLNIMQRFLTSHGATVHGAEHGAAGLALLADIQPSFILLDLSTPVMDGWATLKHLKADPKTAAIPVIALTAHATPGDRERVLKAGFDGYISKPIGLFVFMDVLAEILPEELKS
jgi:CheY-like chemotaxis protein